MFCACQMHIDPTEIVFFSLPIVLFRGQAEQDRLNQLDRARHEVLGSRDERTPEKIFFEQDPCVKKVKPPGRCYGIGEMVEQPCATEAPPAASKVYDGELNEHQLMQKSLLEVRQTQRTLIASAHITSRHLQGMHWPRSTTLSRTLCKRTFETITSL